MRMALPNSAAHDWLRQVALMLLMAMAFALGLPAQAKPVPVPAMSSRVVDLTKTLSADDASSLRHDISVIEQLTQAQLGVLIVPTTGEDSIEQFATRVFAQWKLGRKDENDGVLLLVALKDRRMRIEVGTGLEGRITDIQAARIIDGEMTPRFRQGDFTGGVKAAVQSLSQLISAPQLQAVEEEQPAEPRDEESSPLHRVIDAFSTESSQSRINLALLAVMLWTIGVGVWHGSRPRPVAPRVVSHGTGKRGRKGRHMDAHRAQREGALWADLKTEPASPARRRWPTVLGLLAAGPVAATLALMNLAMPFILFMPVGFMYGVGYLSGRFRTARYVFICIALAIAGLIALGFYLGADKVPLIIAGVVVAGFIAIGIAAIVVGVRVHWQRGVLGFMVRLALVTGVIGFAFVQLRPGPDPDEIWLVMALVSFIALVFGFFPATGGGSGNGDDDDRDSGWSSSSSSSSSSSDSSSSSSDSGGGSSSGGGASGSW